MIWSIDNIINKFKNICSSWHFFNPHLTPFFTPHYSYWHIFKLFYRYKSLDVGYIFLLLFPPFYLFSLSLPTSSFLAFLYSTSFYFSWGVLFITADGKNRNLFITGLRATRPEAGRPGKNPLDFVILFCIMLLYVPHIRKKGASSHKLLFVFCRILVSCVVIERKLFWLV